MNVQIASDLHLEFGSSSPLSTKDRDLLILAGDIDVGMNAYNMILEELQHGDVIYVFGNHEFYYQSLPEIRNNWIITSHHLNDKARQLGYEGTLHVLDDSTVIIQDITFIGSTLWTDMNKENPNDMWHIRKGMCDYQIIYASQDNETTITPELTVDLHKQSVKFIENQLVLPGKKVIITHHLFSLQSVSDCYMDSPLNPAFSSDLDRWFYDYEDIVLAVHGHTHDSLDYPINDSRIICNPGGYYPHELNPNFDPKLIVAL